MEVEHLGKFDANRRCHSPRRGIEIGHCSLQFYAPSVQRQSGSARARTLIWLKGLADKIQCPLEDHAISPGFSEKL